MILTNVDNPLSYQKISHSEYQTIQQSTLLWKLQYVDNLVPETTASYLSKGTYLHKLMERYFLGNEEPIDPELLSILDPKDKNEIDTMYQTWVTAMGKGYIRGGVVRLEHNSELLPLVEQEFLVDVGLTTRDGTEPVLLHGFIDLAMLDDSKVSIVEHKTAGRAWNPVTLQLHQQGILYAAAFAALFEMFPSRVIYNFFYPKTIGVVDKPVTVEAVDAALSDVQAAINLRESGVCVNNTTWTTAMSPYAALMVAHAQGLDVASVGGYVVRNRDVDTTKEIVNVRNIT